MSDDPMLDATLEAIKNLPLEPVRLAPTDPQPDPNCGNCKWWHQYPTDDTPDLGLCQWPLPGTYISEAIEIIRHQTFLSDGKECQTHKCA